MRKAVTIMVRPVLVALLLLAVGQACFAQFGVTISVGFAPPELPVYDQPPCPADGYLWTPGYWAWDPDAGDYYWVPGTWIEAPQVGYLWTPPYWAWDSGHYWFHPGWWGPNVGFYGGIVYGFGYFGNGFEGGHWQGEHFFYNRYVANVNTTVIRNVYETRIETREVTRVSFNGGNGGINARATAQEEAYARDRRVADTRAQTEHIQSARGNAQFRATANHGKPPVAATARAGEFTGHEAVAARSGGNYTPPPGRGVGGEGNRPATENNNRPPNAAHMKDVPAYQRPAAPNTGSAQMDQKYQQQQNKLYDKQNQERQKLEQKQEQDHQKAQQKNYNQERQQQMEQQHQQQTQQMQERHQQQTQQLQEHQASHGGGGAQHH